MSEREDAVALYTFLKEFAQLRTRTIRDVERYEQVIWVSDIPRERGCDCIAWHRDMPQVSEDSDEVWLEIRKPRLTKPPEPPESVDAWVQREQLDDSSLEIPELYTTLIGESADEAPLRLEDHPEVQAAWDTYLEFYWRPWAEEDRREQTVWKIYTNLFSMYQRQLRLGETFEIVFGIGFLSWNLPSGGNVRRHLTAARVSVLFDTVSGTLTVTPAGEGARTSLEQDMLDPQYRPDPQLLRSIEEELEKIGESLWPAGPLDGLLKSWVHSVDALGEYSPALERPEPLGQRPRIHLAPALILRARTERSYIRAFEEIIAQLESGEPIPEGVAQFISVSGDQPTGDVTSALGNGASPSDTFFPLPANDAQRQIVERLNTNQGVLVQGPPGTGKSHTIVNLICHALATGQRVLVTSHTVRALKVLQGMIRQNAPDLAPLSVVLLGDDREALLAMEESVQGITTRQNTWDAQTSEKKIIDLETELDKGRKRQSRVLADLRAIREEETFRHIAKFGYDGTLSRIADALRTERETFSWIPDNTPEDLAPPLGADEFSKLASLLGDTRLSKWETQDKVNIDPDRFPIAEEFEEAVLAEGKALGAYGRDAAIRQSPEYDAITKMSQDDRFAFESKLGSLLQRLSRNELRPLPWTATAMRQILGGFERTWRQLHEATKGATGSMAEQAPWLDRNPVNSESITDSQQLLTDARDLLAHLETGRGWGMGPFRPAVVKRASHIRSMRVGGRLCQSVDAVRDLVNRLDAENRSKQLRDRWAPYHQIKSTTFADLVAELEDLCEPLEGAFAALTTAKELSEILNRTPVSFDSDWSDHSSLHRWSEAIATFEVTQLYEAARERIEQVTAELRIQRRSTRLDPVAEELQTAITERNVSLYTNALRQAKDNLELAGLLEIRRRLLHRLATGAPNLAKALTESPSDAVWTARAENFEVAWNWSRAQKWVTRLAAPGSEEQHRLELERTKQQISRTLELLAAEKAWNHCFNRMTENERQHLVAWSKAVRSIGRGTGRYAPTHRRNAREHLNESRSAIPAWVMPLHRVAETIRPGSELFDIAIIDEASQSGPEALLLAYLAKKLVVVGDDKQIHPTYAGVNFEDVNQLRERYISDLPHADSFGVNQSFFDLAEIRYKGRIRLREHFRCMPEIIQFSNNLSYRGEPLIPLRQYGAGRLEPAVTTRHVPDGYLRGTGATRSVNPPEAASVVAEIVKIHRDPAYAGKTFGVISLVGDAQAREIETRLVRELGPEEMERRQIVCGDAYAFQGDERDVMFLSMVSAPSGGRSIPAMTDDAAQRRFNVAASRARDQLFLFHTATLADLNPQCVRYQLLEYCLNPRVAIPDVSGLNIPEFERLAVMADRQRVRPPIPFDSWFELDVFLHIARRGYRVIPQFEVGGYRIDLVVQGMTGNLAVECDGDEWHGPERYEEDASRQRDLERCGWEFWRVRESVVRLDPDEALMDLWATLERRGVFPTSEEEIRHKAASRDGGTNSHARESEYAPPVEDDSSSIEMEELDTPSGAPRRGWLAEAPTDVTSVEQASSFAPHNDLATDKDNDANSEARSDFPLDKPSVSEPTGERSQEIPQLATPLSPSAQQSLIEQGNQTHPTALGRLSQPAVSMATGEDDWLAPYAEWTALGAVPDLRNASQAELFSLLADVVEQEGPVVAIRAYRLINSAAGNRRLSGLMRRMLNRACAEAIRTGVVVVANPFNLQGQVQLVLRVPGTPEVKVRERGPRDFDELPPDEVAAMLCILREREPELEQEQLKRQLLSLLGWIRLTPKVSDFLDRCISLM